MTQSISQRHPLNRCSNNRDSEQQTTTATIQTAQRYEIVQHHQPASVASRAILSTPANPQISAQTPSFQMNSLTSSATMDNTNTTADASFEHSRNDFAHFLFHHPSDGCAEDENSSFKIHRKLLRRRHVRKEQIRNKREREAERALKAERDERERSYHQLEVERSVQNTKQSTEMEVEASPQKRPLFAMSPGGHDSRGNYAGFSNSPTSVQVPHFSPLRPSKRRNTGVVS